jgi:hypothetical protein
MARNISITERKRFMRYITISALVVLFLGGCEDKSQLPSCWVGESIKDFEGKTMVAMVWIRPTPGGSPFAKNINSAYQVYKRFDGADYKILLSCMKSPELHSTRTTGGEFLYISFLDGSQWIVDFDLWNEKQYVLLRNGQSKILYKLLTEKTPCPAYDPQRDVFAGSKDPNELRGFPAVPKTL